MSADVPSVTGVTAPARSAQTSPCAPTVGSSVAGAVTPSSSRTVRFVNAVAPMTALRVFVTLTLNAELGVAETAVLPAVGTVTALQVSPGAKVTRSMPTPTEPVAEPSTLT